MKSSDGYEPGAASSDADDVGVPGSAEELHARVSSAVMGHRGVFRIEPTLLGTLRGGPGADADPAHGIVLDVRERVVDLEVNISTRAGHQALRTVVELRTRLTDLIVELGFACRALSINVLSVEDVH